MSKHPSPRPSIGSRIKVGNDDPTLTGHAGLLLTGELVRRLEVVEACRRQRVEFCVSVARTEAMWARLYAKLNVKSWRAALDMENAEVAEFAYMPGGWNHEPLRAIVRRVRVAADLRPPDLLNDGAGDRFRHHGLVR